MTLTEKNFDTPLLRKLSDLAAELAEVRFIVVFPHSGGWQQSAPGGTADTPEFCRLVQSTEEGQRQCRMCHALMAVAACSGGATERRCHSGVSVLVSPIAECEEGALAVLSTCTFTSPEDRLRWKETRTRMLKLGIEPELLVKAYDKLPQLDPPKIRIARAIMAAAGDAVREILKRIALEQELAKLRDSLRSKPKTREMVEKKLRDAALPAPRKKPKKQRIGVQRDKPPLLIEVVAKLATEKPGMPFSVEEIAAAARITPNHFSSTFHHYMGKCFTDFLSEKRIALAKELLKDLTLNIGEVALKAGFYDPGYFARRFRQKTGMSPRQWREKLAVR